MMKLKRQDIMINDLLVKLIEYIKKIQITLMCHIH